MRLIDHTCTTHAENLALDEALLEEAEAGGTPCEALRLWEPAAPLVVAGSSSHIAREVDEAACLQRGVPIYRRASGGAAIVAAPGCLMYAVVLSYELRPALRAIDAAHRFVLETVLNSLRPVAPVAVREGTSDLAIAGRKFSGNSLRCKREHFLYHGTLLYDFPLELIDACLRMPPRQPAYRQGRSHSEFVVNLSASAADLRQALVAGWQAEPCDHRWPQELTARLAAEKYRSREWNFRFA